jgi:serine/threonine protein kinase
MTPDEFQRIEALFHEAVEIDPILQQGWIEAHCQEKELQGVLASLLGHHNSEALVDAPVVLVPRSNERTPAGQILDRKYRIEHQLGRGGMGTVFLATHLGTERPVAVKVIRPEFSANSEFLGRFRREAIAAGKLRHPNIVNVTDFGVAALGNRSAAYLVMEYLTGESLADRLAATPKLSLEESLDLLEQICAAVGAAHDLGVIHRDLKPENIWLQPDGRGGTLVKVLDFGLAKITDGPDLATLVRDFPDASRESDTLLTNHGMNPRGRDNQTIRTATASRTRLNAAVPGDDFESTLAGSVMGTPLYMSPEQCSGQNVDCRSDIYSLGVIAYRMLAGETPLTGDNFQLLLKHAEEAPETLRRKRRDIPKGVSETVMRALAKKPADRPASPAAFAAALRVHAEGDAAIILEADRLWSAHRGTTMKLTAATLLPGILLTAFLISGLLQRWGFEFAYVWVIQAAAWLLPFAMLRILSDFGAAALAKALPAWRANQPISISDITRTVHRDRFSLLKLSLRGIFSPQRLLAVPAAVTETPDGAIARSESLLPGLRAFARTQYLRRAAFCCGLVFVTGLVCIPFFGSTANSFWQQTLAGAPTPLRDLRPDLWFYEFLLVTAVLALFTVFYLPKRMLETAVLFETARTVNGESAPVFTPRAAGSLQPKLGLPNWARKPVLVAWLLALSLTWSVVYTVFIPPVGVVAPAERRQLKLIWDEENAWPEYRVAIRKLGSEDFRHTQELQGKIFEYAFRNAPLTDEVRAVLNDNQDALRHLIAGAKRPKFQFITKEKGTRTETPNLVAVRGPVKLAAAEARRLQEAGKPDEAIEVMTAAFRMSTDFAEREGSLISLLISMAARDLCCKMIADWLKRGGADTARQADLLRRLADIDRRMPVSAMPYFDNEARFFQQTMEEAANGWDTTEFLPPGTFGIVQDGLPFAAGLRLCTQRGFQRYWERERPILEEASKRWDFATFHDRMTATAAFDPGIAPAESLELYIAKFSTTLARFTTVRTLYRDHTRTRGIMALLACDIYKKRHGAFPANLETAFKECGVTPQFDPVTQKLPGYRLADGVPELWFVGFDRQDDGGKTPYNLEKNKNQIVPGTDFLMRLGQPVEW